MMSKVLRRLTQLMDTFYGKIRTYCIIFSAYYVYYQALKWKTALSLKGDCTVLECHAAGVRPAAWRQELGVNIHWGRQQWSCQGRTQPWCIQTEWTSNVGRPLRDIDHRHTLLDWLDKACICDNGWRVYFSRHIKISYHKYVLFWRSTLVYLRWERDKHAVFGCVPMATISWQTLRSSALPICLLVLLFVWHSFVSMPTGGYLPSYLYELNNGDLQLSVCQP